MKDYLKKYLLNTINHYKSLDEKILLSDLQIAPFYWLSKLPLHKIESIVDELLSHPIGSFVPEVISAGYLMKGNDWKQCSLCHPIHFAILESLCWILYDNYITNRNPSIEVFYSGSPDNNLFANDKDYSRYVKFVEKNVSIYKYYYSFDVKSFSRNVQIDDLIKTSQNNTQDNLPEEFFMLLYTYLTNIGLGNLPQFKTHSGCRFLSSVVAFEDIDNDIYSSLLENKDISEFKIIRNGDDCLIMFNISENSDIDQVNNNIYHIVSEIHNNKGLSSNKEKASNGHTLELKDVLYSDSLSIKIIDKITECIHDNKKVPVSVSVKILRKIYSSGRWSRRWTYAAIRILLIDGVYNKLNSKDKKFLNKIVGIKDIATKNYIDNFCCFEITNKLVENGLFKDPTISLVVRSHNNKDTIWQCLHNACAQSCENFEVIVVDDGSTDGTLEIEKSFETGYKNCRVLPLSHHGKVYAREIGVRFARGNYVSFCDADDYISPIYYKTLIEYLSKYPKQSMYIFGYQKKFDNHVESFNHEILGEVDVKKDTELINSFVFSNFELGSCMCLFKKNFVVPSLHKNYSQNQFEDFSFTYPCLLNADRAVFIPEELYLYNKTNEGSSTHISNICFDDYLTCAEYWLSLVEKHDIPSIYFATIINLILNWAALEIARILESPDLHLNITDNSVIDWQRLFSLFENWYKYADCSKLGKRNKKLLSLIRKKKFNESIRLVSFDKKLYNFFASKNNHSQKIKNKIVKQIETTNNLISVIIPANNCATTINRCLESILLNNNSQFEIVVVENGSNDNSLEILQDWQNEYTNINLISIEQANVNIARKTGLENSKGNYILFVDSDDCLYPGTVDYLYGAIQQYPNIQLISFDYMRKEDDLLVKCSNYYESGLFAKSMIKADISQHIVFNMNDTLWSYCFRKDFILQQYVEDNSLIRSEDTATIYSCICGANSIVILHDVLYEYRCNTFHSIVKSSYLKRLVNYIYNTCKSIDNIDYQLARLITYFRMAEDE